MRVSRLVAVVLACVMCAGAFAQSAPTNAELRDRLDRLEKEQEAIRQALQARPGAVAPGGKPAMRSSYPIELRGYIKFDAAYDTSRVSTGNFARWVESEATNDNDDELNVTANQSRFGLFFDGPDSPDLKTSGRVEVDFFGGGPENKSHLMMRHAYLQLDWPDSDFSLLAGQTSDVILPLLPSTLNYTVGWWAGNPGYRRPQLRLTKGFKVSDDSRLVLQAAAARTIGDSTAFSPGDTGEDAGIPSIQGRMALSFPCLAEKKATVGVSGHWGQEEFDTDAMDDHEDLDTWSANVDLVLPISSWLTLKGEVFTGENLDAYLGGIGQGVNMTTLEEIETTGGWAALTIGPFDKWTFNVGGGLDDPDSGDLNDGDRSRNLSIFANMKYKINKAVQWGFEVSRWETDYKGIEDGQSYRFQTSFIYSF